MLIALRDLQHRRRRFAISTVAVGVVFGIALLLSGLSAAFGNEARRVVEGFGADAWVVSAGTTGPFTSSRLLPVDVGRQLAELDGVEAVSPLLVSSGVADGVNVNLLGVRFADGFTPDLKDGRLPSGPFEVVVDRSLDRRVGDAVTLAGEQWTIVGRTSGQRYFAGVPVVFARYEDVRDVQIGGLPLASAFLLRGQVAGALPEGVEVIDDEAAVADLRRPLKSAVQTIDAVRFLLWIVAAGIIGSIVYLTVIERTSDLAVLKAIGTSNVAILGGLVFQAAVVALAASVIATAVALALAPAFPMAVEIPLSAALFLPVVALCIAALASLIGIRRAVAVDPALAFAS